MSDIAPVYNFTEWKGNPLKYPHYLALIEEDSNVCIWYKKNDALIPANHLSDGVSYRFKVRLNGDEFAETRPLTANEIWKEIVEKNSDAERTLYAGWMYNFSQWKENPLLYRYGILRNHEGKVQVWKWKRNKDGDEYLFPLRASKRGYKLALRLQNDEIGQTRAIEPEELWRDLSIEEDSY